MQSSKENINEQEPTNLRVAKGKSSEAVLQRSVENIEAGGQCSVIVSSKTMHRSGGTCTRVSEDIAKIPDTILPGSIDIQKQKGEKMITATQEENAINIGTSEKVTSGDAVDTPVPTKEIHVTLKGVTATSISSTKTIKRNKLNHARQTRHRKRRHIGFKHTTDY
ncbi:hypothetical protein KY285_004837 [Solanum tuberosum]|nr:hypothetical protein KY289_005270 [Solanum tuberosum]KAH0751689.1 hypothetical protein KY285_004837 [Solanum tuberosum]